MPYFTWDKYFELTVPLEYSFEVNVRLTFVESYRFSLRIVSLTASNRDSDNPSPKDSASVGLRNWSNVNGKLFFLDCSL